MTVITPFANTPGKCHEMISTRHNGINGHLVPAVKFQVNEYGDFAVIMKRAVYSSLSMLFAGIVVLAGILAWYYIGKILWGVVQVTFS